MATATHGGLIQVTQAVVKHFADHGALPTERSGYSAVLGCTWETLASAFRAGERGLPKGTTFAAWMNENFRDLVHPPRHIGEPALIEAVKRFREQNDGAFPTLASGEIPGLNATWESVEHCLRDGHRGLPSGTTLSRWMDKTFGRRPSTRLQISKEWLIAEVNAYRAANNGDFPPIHSAVPISVGRRATWAQVSATMEAARRPLGLWLEKQYPSETAITEERITGWVERYRSLNFGRLPQVSLDDLVPGGVQSWKLVYSRFGKLPWVQPGTTLVSWMKAKFPASEPRVPLAKAPASGGLIRKDWLLSVVNIYRAEHSGDFPPIHSAILVPGSRLTWAEVSDAMSERRPLGPWLEKLYPADAAVSVERVTGWVDRYRRMNGGQLPCATSGELVPGGVLTWRQVSYRFQKLSTLRPGMDLCNWMRENFPSTGGEDEETWGSGSEDAPTMAC